MNSVILIGRLTRDPELTTTTSGKSVCKFSLAVNRRYKQNGEQEADFFNIVVWNAPGENAHKYLRKGNQCSVRGEIQIRSYEQDGIKRYVTEIIAGEVEFLTPKQGGDEPCAPREKLQPSDYKKVTVSELKPVDESEEPLPF